ncbi:prepilin-type N-terminal cleavage/methylation domain-containing protein [Thalassolituus sp.]|jgi:MSHA pilin protein MshD|uniref:type IV pilus modification PilV family protein n=1 Tax=Thalassolituus sp. TaxID=2030822 RepID=UPI002A80036B|nr:prepilin-type N-terminal cleavage/methylation domain-containing protein [Thalassolituus sp.]|tara:strand:+ start:905 stop:1390 length:486 start_codon:yes stop_codon:yes gene_type:complete
MNRQHGLSMIEMIITMVVISIALVASLSSFSLIGGRSADAMIQTKSLDLAQLYLDEILAQRFDEATGNGGIPAYTGACRITDDGESRSDYDDVDDYDAISNEQPALIDSSLSTLYSGYTVSVSVSCDNTVGANTGGSKRIQITINDPTGDSSVFASFRGNY